MVNFSYIRNGETLEINSALCTGCSLCVEVCPHNVLSVSDGKAAITGRKQCMECGACALNCPEKAISVKSGVGCAAAVYSALIKGSDEPCCGPDTGCCG